MLKLTNKVYRKYTMKRYARTVESEREVDFLRRLFTSTEFFIMDNFLTVTLKLSYKVTKQVSQHFGNNNFYKIHSTQYMLYCIK